MNWTSEYPTQPGYYWLRKYHVLRRTSGINAGPSLVEVEDSLDFYFAGDEDFYRQCHVMHGEWFGPITSPQENRK